MAKNLKSGLKKLGFRPPPAIKSENDTDFIRFYPIRINWMPSLLTTTFPSCPGNDGIWLIFNPQNGFARKQGPSMN